MKTTVYALILFLLPVSNLFAQTNISERLLQQSPNCESVAYNSTMLINEYFDRNEIDSISLLLSEWKSFCGESEPMFRTRVLTDITLNTFDERNYSEKTQLMSMAGNYCDRLEMSKQENYHQVYEYYKIYFGYVGLNCDFDLTTLAWATSLLEENDDLSPVERAWCLLYANRPDDFWEYMKTIQNTDSPLAQAYTAEVERVEGLWDGHLSFLTGAFVPQGNLNTIIGTKFLFGLQLGAKVNKIQFDLTIAGRGGEAREPYDVMYDGRLVTTTDHFGGYFGIDFAYELTNNYKRELDLEFGIGADIMDVIEGESDYYDDSKTLASLNVNMGLGYRFYFKSMNYIGLHAKYNLVNYKNKGGTDLGGNYFSFAVSYDLFGNPDKYKQRQRMKLN